MLVELVPFGAIGVVFWSVIGVPWCRVGRPSSSSLVFGVAAWYFCAFLLLKNYGEQVGYHEGGNFCE